MGEIKFRAWDKEREIMGSIGAIRWNPDMTIRNVDFYYQIDVEGLADVECSVVPFCNLELIQFTGLKDKNGKEIYEGDILRSQYLDYVIEWICNDYHCGFYKKSGDNYTDLNNHSLGEKMEVIGNIYENHELIGK